MTECQKFEAALAETPELERLPGPARDHAGQCVRCARLLADFQGIVRQAQRLAAPEPPPETWDEIRRQLEAEGVIHPPEPEAAPANAAPVPPPLAQSLPRSIR
ncbi:MAG: hypothetical protein ACRD2E_08380 [Terriglobales bacterium]